MRLHVVLVRPRYPGNVGAAVRLAANFAVPRLTIVRPACSLDDEPEFVRMAMGGERLVELTRVPGLADAIAGSQLAVATTSTRNRDLRALHTPEQAWRRARERGVESVALVFGSERGGLTSAELHSCHLAVGVPTNPAFPVLNLAQAVGIVLAAFSGAAPPAEAPRDELDRPAPHGELAAALAHLNDALLDSGYLDPHNPARVADQFRCWFGRTVPTRREVALLHALAAHITYLARLSRPLS